MFIHLLHILVPLFMNNFNNLLHLLLNFFSIMVLFNSNLDILLLIILMHCYIQPNIHYYMSFHLIHILFIFNLGNYIYCYYYCYYCYYYYCYYCYCYYFIVIIMLDLYLNCQIIIVIIIDLYLLMVFNCYYFIKYYYCYQ